LHVVRGSDCIIVSSLAPFRSRGTGGHGLDRPESRAKSSLDAQELGLYKQMRICTHYLLKKPNNAKRVVKLSVATFHQIATVDATTGLKI
jgi:hypothetical protein